MNEIDLVKKLKDFWKLGVQGNAEWLGRAKESFKFYKGDQWKSSVKKSLEGQGKPALTFNHIFSIINLITGFQRQNRRDIKYFPRKGGTKQSAEVLTELAKHTMDISNGIYEQSMMFFDGIITAKGWLGFDIDYNYDPLHGDLVIERYSPMDIVEDPNCKHYDLNRTGEYIIRTYWWSKDALILNYPKKEKDILLSGGIESMEDTPDIISTETDRYQDSDVTGTFETESKSRYKIKDIWWKSWEKRSFIVDLRTLEAKRIDPTKLNMAIKIKEKFNDNFRIVERVIPILHNTVMVGSVVLEDKENPFGEKISMFPFIRFTPYWVDGDCLGMIDNLKDPQREVNKRSSQVLHHLNQSANSGWLGEEGWEVEDEDSVKQFASSSGVSIHYKHGKKPERIVPTPLSMGHLTLANVGAENLKIISGINAERLGRDQTKTESGVAIKEKKESSATVSEIVLDNFDYSLQIFNAGLKEILQNTDLYSEQEIRAVVDDAGIKEVNMAQLKSFKVGRYGVKVGDSPNLPTVRAANFNSLLAAIKAGLPISPIYLMELSDLPNRDEIIADLKQNMERQQQMDQQGNQRPER